MSLAFEKVLAPSPGHPLPPPTGEKGRPLNIAVVFTSVDATLPALRKAGALASRLHGRITLLVPQEVPYPLPLASPPVLLEWTERRFRVIASASPVETRVLLYLCRDRLTMLSEALTPRSLVVVGGRRRWWPTSDECLARQLRRAGHEAIFTETE